MDNIYNEVLTEIDEIIGEIDADLSKAFKNSVPFGMRVAKPKELYMEYLKFGDEKMSRIAQSEGVIPALKYKEEMERLGVDYNRRLQNA